MRFTLELDEYSAITYALKKLKDDETEVEEIKKLEDLIKKLDKQFDKSFDTKAKKRDATKKATNVKIENTKNKIRNAANLLKLENKKITVYSVSKESGVSFNTVKKYSYLIF